MGRGMCPTDAGLEGRERVASEPSGAERGLQGVQVGSNFRVFRWPPRVWGVRAWHVLKQSSPSPGPLARLIAPELWHHHLVRVGLTPRSHLLLCPEPTRVRPHSGPRASLICDLL